MNFDFSVDFSLTYYLLTVASFRIGVPSMLLLYNVQYLGPFLDLPPYPKIGHHLWMCPFVSLQYLSGTATGLKI